MRGHVSAGYFESLTGPYDVIDEQHIRSVQYA
jgi:hypothetical protein